MKAFFCALAAFTFILPISPAGATPISGAGDVVVNVEHSRIVKLSAADGTVLWSVDVANDGALAIDPSDLGIYTGLGSHSYNANATVYKFAADGTLAWSNSISNFFQVSYAAVDATSRNPGIVWIQNGHDVGVAKSNRFTGAHQWSIFTNDLTRSSIDPVSGQFYAIASAGTHYAYHILSGTAENTLNLRSPTGCYTELNSANGVLYWGGGRCGRTLWQLEPSGLGARNWSLDLSDEIASFDSLAVHSSEGGHVYVASVSSSKMVVVDSATQKSVSSFSTVIAPNQIALDPTGENVYVADSTSPFVYAYSAAGSLVWVSPDLGGAPQTIATLRGAVLDGGPTPTPTPTPAPSATPTPFPCPVSTARVTVAPRSIRKGEDAFFTITARDNCADVTIFYEMKGKAKMGIDYTLSGTPGRAFIPAGQGATTVVLHALYNSRKKPAPGKLKLIRTDGYYLGTKEAVFTLLGPYGPN